MIRTRKGFTLVEIMIVVAIIGILIAIAVPGFLKARETSRLNACQENQVKIDGAVQQFILETNEEDQETAVTTIGATDWVNDLVGDGSYIRFEPVCPSGGDYTLQTSGPAVACSLAQHPYPGGT